MSDSHPFAPRLLRAYVWLIAVVVAAFQLRRIFTDCVLEAQLCDFGRFYYAAQAWRAGGELYAPNIATSYPVGGVPFEMQNVASPTWHLAVMPFTYLSRGAAFSAWLALNVIAWAWSLKKCREQWDIAIDHRWYPLIAIIVLLSTLTAAAFYSGQYIGLLMVPATLAWVEARRGRLGHAGAWLGFLASHKPFVLLFLAWMAWNKRWRGVLAGLSVLTLSVLLGELVFGRGIHQAWQQSLRDDVLTWTFWHSNASVWAPWMRALAPSPVYGHLAYPQLAFVLAAGSAVAIGVATLWRLRRAAGVDGSWFILWCAALLMSPLGWIYYLWWAAGPAGAALLAVWRRSPGSHWWIVALAIIIGTPLSVGVLTLGQPSPLASFTIGSVYTWALLGLWATGTAHKT